MKLKTMYCRLFDAIGSFKDICYIEDGYIFVLINKIRDIYNFIILKDTQKYIIERISKAKGRLIRACYKYGDFVVDINGDEHGDSVWYTIFVAHKKALISVVELTNVLHLWKLLYNNLQALQQRTYSRICK